jgi:hypothetical protein
VAARLLAAREDGPLPKAPVEMVLFVMARDLARHAEIKLCGERAVGPAGRFPMSGFAPAEQEPSAPL